MRIKLLIIGWSFQECWLKGNNSARRDISLFSFLPAWNTEVMAGALAAILDYETTLRMKAMAMMEHRDRILGLNDCEAAVSVMDFQPPTFFKTLKYLFQT